MDCAVFLDRDNTLIANDGDLGEPERVEILTGVPEGLLALREAGYRLIVVTNQGGVARGVYTEDDVDAVHQRIAELLDASAGATDLINRFYYCPYHPRAVLDDYRRDHPWRKPHPGMLLQAARDLNIDLARSWMVGDQPRDIAAGRAAGCRTVLVTNGHGTPEGDVEPSVVAEGFDQAVKAILGGEPRPEPPRRTAPAAPGKSSGASDGLRRVERAVQELTDEVRSDRARRLEFTALRMAAGMSQLLVLLLAVLALLRVATPDAFLRWMLGAMLVQLMTIAILLVDFRR